LRDANQAQGQSSERLSSGSRINKAADDAATLAISEKTRASIRSIRQGERNANDGIAIVQTAEGALNEVSSNLIRLRELSIQAATGTYGDSERSFMNAEGNQIKDNVKSILSQTKYNGVALFTDNTSFEEVHVGVHNNSNVDRVKFDFKSANGALSDLSMAGVDLRSQAGAQNALDAIDTALSTIQEVRATLGGSQNRLQSSANGAMISAENWEASYSRMRDTDVANEQSESMRTQIQQNVGISMLSQANSLQGNVLRLIS